MGYIRGGEWDYLPFEGNARPGFNLCAVDENF
jgi:hypothetical protein